MKSGPKPDASPSFDDPAALDVFVEALPALAPPPELWHRIEHSTAGVARWAHFAPQVAQLLDVSAHAAAQLLVGLDDPQRWRPGFFAGMELVHVVGGPRAAGAITGFVRLSPGTVFPEHRHLGEERVLVLSGRCQDGERVFAPGEIAIMKAGSSHSFRVLPGPDFVYLAVVEQGLVVGGRTLGPADLDS